MRALTFHGFLNGYVRRLSGSDTGSMVELFQLVRKNPRLKAPVVLYAITALPEAKLAKLAAREDVLATELNLYFSHVKNAAELLDYLQADTAPEAYRKVYKSYTAQRDRYKRERELKQLIREKVLLLSQEKGVSDYRVYKDLGINNGNFHAFVHKGDVSKLGLEKARQLLEYYEAC